MAIHKLLKNTKDNATVAALIPPQAGLRGLRQIAAHCKACPLWKTGTQTVFGEGPAKAQIVFVGEIPGDKEDQIGRPFVGPAGRIFDEALAEVGLDRQQIYVTNIVKHFKWVAKGKRRIHEKPNSSEIHACRPWLNAELDRVKPDILVCLGATAAQGLIDKQFKISQQRGKWIDSQLAPHMIATVHPSSILRSQNEAERRDKMELFIADLKIIAKRLRHVAAG